MALFNSMALFLTRLVMAAADKSATANLPIVLTVGMGDTCKKKEMLVRYLSKERQVPIACFGTYDLSYTPYEGSEIFRTEAISPTLTEAVHLIAAKLKEANWEGPEDPFANGFNGIGLSQGNLILRGYLQRVNSPPMKNWISVHGPLMGVGGIPECNPESLMCQNIFSNLCKTAYSKNGQSQILQSNYVRNSMLMESYLATGSFIADLNNEIPDEAPTKVGTAQEYRERFSSLDRLVLVKAQKESVIVPDISSWFGFYKDGTYDEVSYPDSDWFKEDWFGLKMLHDAGKVELLETAGQHTKLKRSEWKKLFTYL